MEKKHQHKWKFATVDKLVASDTLRFFTVILCEKCAEVKVQEYVKRLG